MLRGMPSFAGLRMRLAELNAPAPMREFSDYDEYWQRRGELNMVHERWKVAAEWIEDGATVLDVGCGSGEFLRHLQTRRPNVRARGIDLSTRAAEMAQANGFDAGVVNVANEDIPDTYDYITCFEVLEHIPDAEAAILRLKKAVRRAIIISIPNVGYIGSRIRLGVFGRFPVTNCVYHISEHVRHWTPKDFSEWVGHHGLTVERQSGQYGVPGLWTRRPALFAAGMVYFLVESEGRTPSPS